MFKRIVKSFIIGRTVTALSQLSDRQLDDIGVIRSEITSYAERVNG